MCFAHRRPFGARISDLSCTSHCSPSEDIVFGLGGPWCWLSVYLLRRRAGCKTPTSSGAIMVSLRCVPSLGCGYLANEAHRAPDDIRSCSRRGDGSNSAGFRRLLQMVAIPCGVGRGRTLRLEVAAARRSVGQASGGASAREAVMVWATKCGGSLLAHCQNLDDAPFGRRKKKFTGAARRSLFHTG